MSEFPFGRFSGHPHLQWEGPREYRLLQDFSFQDPDGKIWTAEDNRVVNGVTMPRIFWEEEGPPVATDIFPASIVHDAECEEGADIRISFEQRKAADRMFYFACRACGADKSRAARYYAAVRGAGVAGGMADVVVSAMTEHFSQRIIPEIFLRLSLAQVEEDLLDRIDGMVK